MKELSKEEPVSLSGYEIERLISLLKERISKGCDYLYGIRAIEYDIRLLRKLEKARREKWGGVIFYEE